MTLHRTFAFTLLTLSGPVFAGSSPWLPEPESLNGSLSYVYQTAKDFYAGNKRSPLPADLEQHTVSGYLEYGVSDSIAVDARLGYATTEFIQNPVLSPSASLDGFTDTNLGVRWRVLDELIDDWLTLTFRAAGIIEGDYRVGALNAIGDGASGGEFSALLGRNFDNGLSLSLETGYRTRNKPVPDEFFSNFRGGYAVTNKLGIGVSYQVAESLSGIDIGAPGFTPARFPAVNEDYQVIGADLNYSLTSRTSVSVNYATTVDGRNTGNFDIVGVNFGFSY